MTRSSTPSAKGDESLKSGFKLVLKKDPNTVYETDLREFVVGRSKQCEIVIKDPHISRVQARIRFEDNHCYLENVGRNPIHINGLPTSGQFLNEGDEITLGTTNLRFQTGQRFDNQPLPMVFDDQTIAVASLPQREQACQHDEP